MRVRPSIFQTLVVLGSILFVGLITAAPSQTKIRDEQEAEDFMKELDARYSQECNLEMVARWEYIVDVLDQNKEQAANKAAVRYLNFQGEAATNCSEYDYSQFESIDLYRRFRFLSKQGPGALDSQDLTEFKDRQSTMETTYSTATICDYYDQTKCDLTLEPDIEYIMATSENYEELRYVWDQWREVSGKLMREDFLRFVELSNKAAVLDGFSDTGMYWLNGYTVDDRESASFAETSSLNQNQFKQMVDDVWQKVSEGLYKKLHSWVRYRMSEIYPEHIDLEGPMPANILGNMWAQDWVNIADHVMPFKEFPSFDVTESMVKNGWNIQQIFESSEDFFKSIGLFPMTQTFWDKSVVNQTAWGKIMLCHASAEDFCLGPEGSDYRIKMCTEVNMEDLVTVHHEMGHIEYFMAYKNQPHVFRESANPGFHEAIGDLIALSVSTPSHMENVLHLSPDDTKIIPKTSSKYTDDEKRDLNFLMRMALEKISFLPFGYLIDKFRWGVFDGTIPEDKMNAAWWQLREDLQGVIPPGEPRGEEFFDAGSKYHVPANVPYIRYFVSFIVQFQFHAHLCEIAGHTGPLHKCDIYNNTDAGAVLKLALERGLSEPWPIILKDLGGSLDMDPEAIISYFDPLIQFLDEELETANQCIGWGDDCNHFSAQSDLPTIDGESDTTTTIAPTTEKPEPTTEKSEPTTPEPDTTTPKPEPTTQEPDTTTQKTDPQPSDDTTSTPKQETSPVPSTSSESSGTTTADTTTETPEPEPTTEDPDDEGKATEDMENLDYEMTLAIRNATVKNWHYATDINDDNLDNAVAEWTNVQKSFQPFYRDVIRHFNYTYFSDDLKRQFELQKNLEVAALNDEDLDDFAETMSNIAQIYGNKVCPANKKNCDEDKDGLHIHSLSKRMSDTDSEYDDLKYYWEEWRAVSGKKMIDDFKDYITLQNKAAEANDFKNPLEMWLDPYTDEEYDTNDFVAEIEYLWNQTKPLYMNLRAYVLHKLKDKYDQIDEDDDLVPAHVLGDMWGESWESLYDLVKPFEDETLPDITEGLKNLDSVSEIIDLDANEFFINLGLSPMTQAFKEESIFETPGGQNMNCEPTAWDFYDVYSGDLDPSAVGDFRISMCGELNQQDFLEIYNQMSKVQYMMAYSKRVSPEELMPLVFRDAANPAFHEAIGGTIGLVVSSPTYLLKVAKKLNMTVTTMLPTTTEEITEPTTGASTTTQSPAPPSIYNTNTEKANLTLNFLLKTALSKVPMLPYAYGMHNWRTETFEDNNDSNEYNKRWWEWRIREQGIAPPSKRLPESEFDAGARRDIVDDTPYIWHFVSTILQFQFHKELCKDEEDIALCNFDDETEIGDKLKSIMVYGRSKRWQDLLQDFMEDPEATLDPRPLLEYFSPLNEHLEKYIKENKLAVQWDPDQIDKFMDEERAEISATVPIIVGCVLAVMVCVVIVAYFVGQKKQSKKRKALEAQQEAATSGLDNLGMDTKEDQEIKEKDNSDEKDKDSSDEEAEAKF